MMRETETRVRVADSGARGSEDAKTGFQWRETESEAWQICRHQGLAETRGLHRQLEQR